MHTLYIFFYFSLWILLSLSLSLFLSLSLSIYIYVCMYWNTKVKRQSYYIYCSVSLILFKLNNAVCTHFPSSWEGVFSLSNGCPEFFPHKRSVTYLTNPYWSTLGSLQFPAVGGGLVAKLYPTLETPWTLNTPGPFVHEIFQARILEWVAISFSKGSSQPRNQTQVSYIAGRFFPNWAIREAQLEIII